MPHSLYIRSSLFTIMCYICAHVCERKILPTLETGRDEVGFFSACITNKLFIRMSVPGGGPSKYITALDGELLRRNSPCNCTQSLSVACELQ